MRRVLPRSRELITLGAKAELQLRPRLTRRIARLRKERVFLFVPISQGGGPSMAIVERSDFATMLDRAIERSGKGAEVKQLTAQPEAPVRRREVTSR
jgi:hypothetical protein